MVYIQVELAHAGHDPNTITAGTFGLALVDTMQEERKDLIFIVIEKNHGTPCKQQMSNDVHRYCCQRQQETKLGFALLTAEILQDSAATTTRHRTAKPAWRASLRRSLRQSMPKQA